jgi:phage baseplate assembly protein W
MVDVTRIDKITRKDKTSNEKPYYSDFYTNFNVHPQNKRLVKYTNENSVKRSVRNLILTEPGERLFQPDVGCKIRRLLFENMSNATTIQLKSAIEETITLYEKRARIITVDVVANEDLHNYDVYIIFEVINSITPVALNITLDRAR